PLDNRAVVEVERFRLEPWRATRHHDRVDRIRRQILPDEFDALGRAEKRMCAADLGLQFLRRQLFQLLRIDRLADLTAAADADAALSHDASPGRRKRLPHQTLHSSATSDSEPAL